MKNRLLVIDSDADLVRRLASRLTGVFIESTTRIGECPMNDFSVVLVNLDYLANDFSRVIRQLRSRQETHCSILAYADCSEGMDAVLAYDAGADDCFSKSTDLMVIEAKIRSALARCSRCHAQLTERHRTAQLLDSMDEHLTRFERHLLQILSSTPGQVVSKAVIVQAMWGRRCAESKLIYEHISTLRSKLGAANWTITNVRGRGYRLERLDRGDPPTHAKAPSQMHEFERGSALS